MTAKLPVPPQFVDLERFVPYWAADTVDGRVDARCRCSMEEIREFYDAMILRAPAVMDYLDGFTLADLPEEGGTMLRLMLGLAHASIAVEIQQQPLPPKTEYPFRVRLVAGVAPFG